MIKLTMEDICEDDYEYQENPENFESGITDTQVDVFNYWYHRAVVGYNALKKINKASLSSKEIEFIMKNDVMNAISVCYSLLSKYTSKTEDEQINLVLSVLDYLSACKIPKEYAGGFLILICKYHLLP